VLVLAYSLTALPYNLDVGQVHSGKISGGLPRNKPSLTPRLRQSGAGPLYFEKLHKPAHVFSPPDMPPAIESGSATLPSEDRFGKSHELFFDVPVLHGIIGMP
jgi:hypothetical protein